VDEWSNLDSSLIVPFAIMFLMGAVLLVFAIRWIRSALAGDASGK
jgi:hypothetical protein